MFDVVIRKSNGQPYVWLPDSEHVDEFIIICKILEQKVKEEKDV